MFFGSPYRRYQLTFLLKTAVTAFLIPLVLLLIWVGYLWITYIDKSVTEGVAYGFEIGSTKSEIYRLLPQNLYSVARNPGMYFVYLTVTEPLASGLGALPESRLLLQTQFTPYGYSNFEAQDVWKIYLEGSFRDSITLLFCNDELCEIRRHRQYFELP